MARWQVTAAAKAAIEQAQHGDSSVSEINKAPFRNPQHAAEWYFEHSAKYRSAKTNLAATQEALTMGCFVGGGRGSVVERDLCLIADVEGCLPFPLARSNDARNGTCPHDLSKLPPHNEIRVSWERWVCIYRAFWGDSIEGCAETVRRYLDVPCSTDRAYRLITDGLRLFTRKLRDKGLIP